VTKIVVALHSFTNEQKKDGFVDKIIKIISGSKNSFTFFSVTYIIMYQTKMK